MAVTKTTGLKFKHDYYPPFKSFPVKVEGRVFRTKESKGCVMGSSRALKDWLSELFLQKAVIEFDGYTTTRQGRTGNGIYLVNGQRFYFAERLVMNEALCVVKRWNGQFWEDEK